MRYVDQGKVFVCSCPRVYLTCELTLYQMQIDIGSQTYAVPLVEFANKWVISGLLKDLYG